MYGCLDPFKGMLVYLYDRWMFLSLADAACIYIGITLAVQLKGKEGYSCMHADKLIYIYIYANRTK